MSACPICGCDPCINASLCSACSAADKTATEDLGAQLAAKLEEQRNQQEQEQEARLKELAQKDPVSYDRHRQGAAKELGIRAGTLDHPLA